jgi:CHAD domain-containing protein
MKHSRSAHRPALQGGPRCRFRPPGGPDAPVKAKPAALECGMPVSDAFRAVMRANLEHLQGNQRGVLAGRDPEYLHQMRVALRRLRSAVAIFAPLFPDPVISPVRAELKWLAASLGPARDWDVFVAETLPPIVAELGPHEGLRDFAARCEKLRRGARQRARRAVRSARYRRFALWLAAWLASEEWLARVDLGARTVLHAPVAGFAGAALEQRYRQVLKRGRNLAGRSAIELHRLRIAVKKFRYAADFFAALYNEKSARAALKRLSGLQDILGAMNDAAAVVKLMPHGPVPASNRRVLETKRILVAWSRRRRAVLKRELIGAWKAFRAVEKFW